MNTIKGSSVWLYFFKTDDPGRVKCKLCKRLLRSQRKFNLKQHLKSGHKIEVRLRGRKRNETEPDFIKAEFMEENDATSNTAIVVNEALESNEHILSDPMPPLIPFSTIEKKTSKAGANETTVQDKFDDIDPLATRSILNLKRDSKGLHSVALNNNNELIEPTNTDNEQILIDGTLYQVKQTAKTKKRGYKTKSVPISSDNTLVDTTLSDEQAPPFPKKEDNFDDVFRKRKQLTELEYLQMQNYKIKLELWAMEQKLQVKSSKFTKDIEARNSQKI